MEKHHPNNERIKRKYFTFLKEAKGQSVATVDAAAKALNRFEAYTGFRDFKAFHHKKAVAFKTYLAKQKGKQSGKALSQATQHGTLMQLKRFFQWLSQKQGYKSYIQYCDAEYFNMSGKNTRIATAKRPQKFPTIEEVKSVISKMPTSTEIERRNHALIAFTLLTAARNSAITSMKLKHIDITGYCVNQDAREVKTKFSKTFTTYFFPVGDEIREIVEEWVAFLRDEKNWGNDDPLFPATRTALGKSCQFEVTGLTNKHWRTTSSIRDIFKEAFISAGMPYFKPHSFRHTLAQLGEKMCNNMEELKAWSQNFGHEDLTTTLFGYGEVAPHRQGEIIRDLAIPRKSIQADGNNITAEVIKGLRRAGVKV